MALKLTSPAFADGEEIPIRHTCEGEDVSPPLAWSGVPGATRSLVLVVDDPDAPDPKAPKRTWVHWVLYDIPPEATWLPEGVHGAELPAGARVGSNDWSERGYRGPCPPVGRHRYFFKLVALDAPLGVLDASKKAQIGGTRRDPRANHEARTTWAATKADVERAMEGHVLAQAELVGTYEKKR